MTITHFVASATRYFKACPDTWLTIVRMLISLSWSKNFINAASLRTVLPSLTDGNETWRWQEKLFYQKVNLVRKIIWSNYVAFLYSSSFVFVCVKITNTFHSLTIFQTKITQFIVVGISGNNRSIQLPSQKIYRYFYAVQIG